MKPFGNKPEVIILGSGIGGLIAGALLSKNNHSVLVLKDREYHSYYNLKGYHFVPFSNFSEKRLSPGFLKKISQSLTLSLTSDQERNKPTKINSKKRIQKPGFQVILPKARIDVLPNRLLFEKEWKREFPQELKLVQEFYKEMDQIDEVLQRGSGKNGCAWYSPLRQRSLITSIFPFDRFPKERVDEKLGQFSREFRKFIQLQLVSWGNLYSERFPVSLAAHILSGESNDSIGDLDPERLERKVLNELLKYGGRVEEITGIKQVDFFWRKGISLSLEEDSRGFGCQFLILNSPLHRILSLMGKASKRLSKRQEKVKPLYVIIPLFLGIREKTVPVGMKDLLVSIFDLEKPYDDGNVLFLSLSAKGDETMAPEGRRALTVGGLMNAEKWGQTILVDYQQGVMKHLSHLFPFLGDGMEFIDVKWASDHIPRWSYPHYFYENTSDGPWTEEAVPTRIRKNIYFIGKENFPASGIVGEIYSGLTVAQRILKKFS